MELLFLYCFFFLFPSTVLLENVDDVVNCIPCFVTTHGSHSCRCSLPVVCYSLHIEFESTLSVLCDMRGLDSGVVEILGAAVSDAVSCLTFPAV